MGNSQKQKQNDKDKDKDNDIAYYHLHDTKLYKLILPFNVTIIEFCDLFNKSVDNLPNSVRYIKFGHYFNQSVDHLPNRVTHIEFGEYFNKPIRNLPKSVKTICFHHKKGENIFTYNNFNIYIKKIIYKFSTFNKTSNYSFSLTYLSLRETSKIKKLPYGCVLKIVPYYYCTNVEY